MFKDALEDLYLGRQSRYLSEINRRFLANLCGLLGIDTPIVCSSELSKRNDRNLRLIDICRQLGAAEYYTGVSAKKYLDEKQFLDAGLTVHYCNYAGFPEYEQLYPPFEHQVSIVDVIMNTGAEAGNYILPQ